MTNQISNKISNKITSEMSVVTSLLLAEVNKNSNTKIELRTVNEKSDSNAFTNGRNLIQIPLNFQNLGGSDGKRWRSIGYGYLSHETSHCRNTDFSCMREISSYGQEGKTLLNIIEDPRIERLTVAQYPGQWEHINNMNAHIIEQGWWSGPQGESVTINGTLNSYCLYYGETVSGFELTRPLMEEWEPIFNDLFSRKFGDEVPDKIRAFVKNAVLSDDKKAAVKAVKNILELLQKGKSDEISKGSKGQQSNDSKDEKSKEATDNKSEASKDGKSEEAKDNKSNVSKDEKSEGAKDNKSEASKGETSEEEQDEKSEASKGETSEEEQDEKSNVSKGEKSKEANDQKSNASKGEASEEAQDEKSETSKDEKSEGSSERFGGKILTTEDKNQDHPETASQKLFQGMKQNCTENAGTSLPMMSNVGGRLTDSPYNVRGDEDIYKPLGLRLKREFQRKLQSKVLGNKGCSQSGHKILRNKLSGIATGNYQIFSNRDMVKLPNVAIEVLVDTSGSMREIMKPALNAAGAILVGLENLKGIETEMSLFPGYFDNGRDYDRYDDYTIAKGFNEPLKPQRVAALCGGGTYCNYGVMGVTLNLIKRKKKDKICVVITDGDINSNTKDVIDYGKSQGIKYYCIGLNLYNTEDVSKYFENFVNIDNINELQQVLIKLVREVIEI